MRQQTERSELDTLRETKLYIIVPVMVNEIYEI